MNLDFIKQDYYLLAPKRELKDSIFRRLFSIPRYLRELYLSLGGDPSVREDEISVVSSENIFCGGLINDLAFTVRKKELYIVEAQSTKNPNMSYRINNYFLSISRKHIEGFQQRQYSSVPFRDALNPHFFVIYTGKGDVPPYYDTKLILPYCEDYSVRAKVLTAEREDDIIRQYCLFCLKFNEFTAELGREKKAVLETVRYCENNNILKDFLMENHQEVEAIMMEYNTQEMVTIGYGMEMEKRGIDKGIGIGKAEGISIGRAEGKAEGISIGKTEGSRLTEKRFRDAIVSSGISEEAKDKIMENFKKLSSE